MLQDSGAVYSEHQGKKNFLTLLYAFSLCVCSYFCHIKGDMSDKIPQEVLWANEVEPESVS